MGLEADSPLEAAIAEFAESGPTPWQRRAHRRFAMPLEVKWKVKQRYRAPSEDYPGTVRDISSEAVAIRITDHLPYQRENSFGLMPQDLAVTAGIYTLRIRWPWCGRGPHLQLYSEGHLIRSAPNLIVVRLQRVDFLTLPPSEVWPRVENFPNPSTLSSETRR